MTDKQDLQALRQRQGFTIEQTASDQWAIMLEELAWDVFDCETDAIKEIATLNKECADCI